MESYLSGYCRTIDASRMVLVEDGEADCDYVRCDYRDVCPIGRQIAGLLEHGEEIDPVYLDAAYAFGRLLAQHGHTLVYGGGAQGVMGAAARGAYEAGGKITGIAPTFLQVDGILFDHCTEFLLTDTMAERKTAMIARADAFVMAPGGFGTLEEFFEVLTLKQLGRHNPAIAVLNTGGFYDSLQSFVRSAVERRFIRPACLQIYALLPTPEETLAYLEQYDAAALDVRHLKNI